ncbi:MAG: winged helix-turn-helix domain-containing protein [Myxococcota bacterium]
MRVPMPSGVVDLDRRLIVGEHEEKPLREKEARLLRYLVERANAVVPRTELLVKVFGYAPTTRTGTLATTVRRLRAALEIVGGAGHVQSVYGEGYRYHNPRPPTPRSLFGRATALATLRDALQQGARLITVVGFGGMGKTALAQALLEERGDGLFCSLEEATGTAHIWAMIAASLRLNADQVHPQAVIRALKHRAVQQPWLVLDNVEVQIAAVRAVVERCLRDAPSVQIVVTSRVRLALSEEHLIELGPLSAQAATALLRARGQALGVDLSEHDLSDIVEAFDKHPLSIEIAAGRLRMFTLPQLRRRLDARLRLLKRPDGPHRHRDVRSLVTASLDLMEPGITLAIQQIAALPGAFDVQRFEAIVHVPGAWPEDLMQSLIEHHLVQRDAVRFRLHFMVRDVVIETAPADVLDGARRRFIVWVEDRLDAAQPELHPQLDELQEGIQACQTLGDRQREAKLVAALGDRWRAAGRAAAALRPWLDVPDPVDPKTRARLSVLRAFVGRFTDPPRTLALAEIAVENAAMFPRVLEDALYQRSRAHALMGDPEQARHDAARLLTVHIDDPAFRVHQALDAASTYWAIGDAQRAEITLEAARADVATAPLDDQLWFDALGLSVAMERGAFERARQHGYRQWRRASEEGTLQQQVRAALDLGFYEAQHERMEHAYTIQNAVRGQAWRCGHWIEMRLLCNLMILETWMGRIPQARITSETIQALVVNDRTSRAARLGRRALSQLFRVCGQLDDAHAWHQTIQPPAPIDTEVALWMAQSGDLHGAIQYLDTTGDFARLAIQSLRAELLALAGDHRQAQAEIDDLLSNPLPPIVQQPMRALQRALRGIPPQAPSQLLVARCWDIWNLYRLGACDAAETMITSLLPDIQGCGPDGEINWRIAHARAQSSNHSA